MKDESISSLADQVIDILKSSGCIEINDLATCLGVDVTEIEKVIGILEREDLAKIEYQFTKTYVLWAGEGSEDIPMPPVENQVLELEEKSIKKPVEKKPINDIDMKINGKLVSNGKNGKYPKGSKENGDKPEIKYEEKEKKSLLLGRTKDQTIPGQRISQINQDMSADGFPSTYLNDSKANDTNPNKSEDEDISAISLKLRQSIEVIKAKKTELAELHRQEEGFLEERYTPLNSRIEMEIGTITEMIIEKENEIEQQKAKAKLLIDKVSDIEVETLKIRDTELTARREFEKALGSLEGLLERIRETRRGLGYEVRVSKRALTDQSDDISNINVSIASLAENERDIEKKISLAKARIEEEKKILDSITAALNESKMTRGTVQSRMDEMGKAFDSQSLNEIDENINNLTKLEVRLEACRREYSNALGDLKARSRENAEEVEKLRETIQFNLVRKMAKELDKVGTDYENKMSEAFEDEKALKMRIADTKERLNTQIKYAKELSKRLLETVPKGTDVTDAKMMCELKDIESIGSDAASSGAFGSKDRTKRESRIIDEVKEAFSNFKKGLQNSLNKDSDVARKEDSK